MHAVPCEESRQSRAPCTEVALLTLRLREHEDRHQEGRCNDASVQPPEVAPANVQSHRAGDNRTDHQASHVEDPVQCVPKATVMQKENVRNHCWLDSLCWTGTEAIENACAHERAICHCPRSPDGRRKAYQLGEDIHWPAPEGRANRYPDEVAEAKDQDGNTCELHHVRKIGVECGDQVGKHWSQSQRSHTLREGDTCRSSDAAGFPEWRPVQRIVRVGGRLWD
jgi:hypothetical protein